MLAFCIALVLVLGVNTIVWTTVGLVRFIRAQGPRRIERAPDSSVAPTIDQVAILVAAHNEALVIERTIRSAIEHVAPTQVFVVSDGSTDDTVAIARAAGAQVWDLHPNRGKAGAIAAAIEHFRIAERFEVLMLLDADTHLSPDYFTTGLREFDAPDIVAVAGRATTIVDPNASSLVGRLLVAYRERVYVAVQYLQKFGQASRHANVVAIVPGFASMYRTRVLKDIDITAEGLAIEDFNMTFEVHAKRLGRIAFRPGAAIAYTQDPDTLRDYAKQVRRWNLGFWQTLKRHRVGLTRFGAATSLFVAELLTSSLMMLAILPALAAAATAGVLIDLGVGGPLPGEILQFDPVLGIVIGVLLPDYVLTLLVAVVARRPIYIVFGVIFPLIRILDSYLCLRALLMAFRGTSSGVWHSPTRRLASSSA
ncbi:glycosyltransferase family 2 protein [Curtobacterium ammoniigenes]|uniref:glycosyltransferase family 2 protein n=1 Tax=Curtobacterium ammoniigenes TaxID=395387 RepID=UPI000831AB4E|nr:glycosyltransferase family 2 protein [Curtobacterium ammoniigenes]